MKLSTLLNVSKILGKSPGSIVGSRKYIFLLSHMRSYSSLLSHILGSHNEISGYSEMHLSYKNKSDLTVLRYRVYSMNNNNLDGTYVFDKILHNHYISNELLNSKNIKNLFMLRAPEDTIKSISKMSSNLNNPVRLNSFDKIGNYYIERLKHLSELVKRTNRNAVYLDAEKIVHNTDFVLGYLTDWLQLPTKLSSEYKTFSHTGKPGFGDPSDNIKQGKIIKNRETADVTIPEELLKKANEEYLKCRETMINNCTII
jgi:hypothetical protein